MRSLVQIQVGPPRNPLLPTGDDLRPHAEVTSLEKTVLDSSCGNAKILVALRAATREREGRDRVVLSGSRTLSREREEVPDATSCRAFAGTLHGG